MSRNAIALLVAIAAATTASCSDNQGVPVTEESSIDTATTAAASTIGSASPEASAGTSTPSASAATAAALAPSAPSTTVAADPDAFAFIDQLFQQDADAMRLALQAAAPGSPAETYATYRIASDDVNTANGLEPFEPSQVSVAGETIEVCDSGRRDCSAFADFQSVDGRITFTIEGDEIDPRLAGPVEPVVVGPATIAVTVAYRVISTGELAIVLNLSTTADVDPSLHSAVYIGPDGRQVSQSFYAVPNELFAGAQAPTIVVFPGADPRGRLIVEMFGNDFADTTASISPFPPGPRRCRDRCVHGCIARRPVALDLCEGGKKNAL